MEGLLVQENLPDSINCRFLVVTAVARVATAPFKIIIIVFKLPYIMYRAYPNFGYLTDNRNFGYDTASMSRLKVGDLILSKTGSVFYSQLSDTPKKIENIIGSLCELFADVPYATIKADAVKFFTLLHSKGFVYLGEEVDFTEIKNRYFSYDKVHPYVLQVSNKPETQKTYETTFGKDCRLTRLHVDISSRCNENCVHCYIPTSKKRNLMTEDMFDVILRQSKVMNILNITISGGEPMLNPSLNSFLQKCKVNNLSVNLLTNLTLLTEELLDVISDNPLISVQTSLYAMDEKIHDAITQQRGSFKKTISAIERLREKNVPLQINCPIMKANSKQYIKVLKYAKLLNVEADSDYLLYGCYDFSKSNLSCRLDLDEVEHIIHEKLSKPIDFNNIKEKVGIKKGEAEDPICPVCKNSLCISNTGDVYPCEGWQSLIIGNLKEQSLKELWENSVIINHLRSLKFKDFPKCILCPDKKYCNTCLVMNANEDVNGNYMHVNTFQCEAARIKHRQMKMKGLGI